MSNFSFLSAESSEGFLGDFELSRRDLALFGSATALLAGRAVAAAPKAPSTGSVAASAIDPAAYVNPEFKAFLPLIKATATGPVPTLETLKTSRAGGNPMIKPPMDKPAWAERTIPGPAGAPDVNVCVINAGQKGAPRPAILHTHGGGFVFMAAKDYVRAMQEVAAALDCVIVSVDYRKAPETRFPGSLEDNYAALKWLYAHAAELGADPKNIALLGDSAGGGHAAMLAIAARDRGEVPLVFQALVYPMLDDRTGSTKSVAPQNGAFVWRAADNRFGWSCLLGQPAGSAKVPYGSVPARVDDLRKLPPTFIGVGSIDLFMQEDVAYAQRLTEAAVPVELQVYPGCFHAFDYLPAAISARFKADVLRALAGGFGRVSPPPPANA